MEKFADLKLLLTPSWLSSSLSIILAVMIVGISAVLSRLTNNTLQQEIFAVHQVTAKTSASYQVITNNLARNSVISNMPLFLFWVGVGCIVYIFSSSIYRSFSRAVSIEQSLHYMHANRHQVLKLETERFILRFLSLVFGFLCIRYFLHQPLPYSMDLARRGARQWSIHNGLDMLWAVVIIAFMFAVFTIFLRLIMLRPRLFGSNYASEE